MKVLAALCLLFAVATAEYIVKTRENLLQFREQCVSELGIDAEHVEQFKKWQYPNDAITQCYLKCVFIKFGLFSEKEGWNVELIHHQLLGQAPAADHANDELHNKIVGCIDKNEQGSSVCEWAYRGATCFFKQNLQIVQQSVAPAPQA